VRVITAIVSEEAGRRLQDAPDRPRREWGKNSIPKFYGRVLEAGMNGLGSFRERELQHRIECLEWRVKRLEAELSRRPAQPIVNPFRR
jgi:hypothetical protein